MASEVNISKIMPKIISALDKLLSKTDFDSLTIKELASEVGFSRQYFYRAFSDKYALIVELFEYDMKRGIEVFFAPTIHNSQSLRYILENREIYRSILASSYSGYLFDIIYNYGIEFVRAMSEYVGKRVFTKDEESALKFFLLGVTSMLAKNIMRNDHLTKEELDRVFYDNTPAFLEFLKSEDVTKDYVVYKIAKYRERHVF